MTELMSLHGWGYPALRFGSSDGPKNKASRSPDGRSPAAAGRSPSPNKTVLRARSSNALTEMAGGSAGSSFRRSPSIYEENSLNTLKDPRVASTSDLSSSNPSGVPNSNLSPHHPDLNSEVAALSDKLIQAINNQTMLDASLSSTRQELDASRAKVAHLEQKCREHEDELSSGRLIKTHDIELERSLMREALEDEKARRITAEKEKKGIEQELENLTAALFDEANKMVAAAKKEREAAERKNDQLRAQVKDTELLVASHQEQLAELKSTMQQMHGDRDDATDSKTNPSTAPVSPAFANANNNNQHDSIGRRLGAVDVPPDTPGSGNISPAPSTSFGHLIKSVCRRDIPAYDDFQALLHQATPRSNPHSRTGSASSYGGRSVMSFGNFTANNRSSQNLATANGGSGSTTPSGATAQTSTPNGLTASPRDLPPQLSVPLKETRFYKRVLTEDIEPALRLDTAPSISWLTRRSVLSSICEGSLVIEPLPSVTIRYAFPCSLCGERRNGNENPRLHRFRTSDSDSAQRYTLCMVCLEKMRSCCDFVGFLRLIVDGHVRAVDEEDEREAWEETVRLRERLFWARIGGGVVPTFVQKKDSERDENSSVLGTDSPRPCNVRESTAQDTTQRLEVRDASAPTADEATDPFVSKAERVSIGNSVISIRCVDSGPSEGTADAAESQHQEERNEESEASRLEKDEGKQNGDDAAKATPNSESPHLVERQEKTEENDTKTDKDTASLDSSHLTSGDADNTHGSISRPRATSTSSVATSKSAKGAEQSLKVAIPASFEL